MSNPEVNRPVYFSQMDLYEERRLYVKRLIDGPRFGGSKAAFAKEADISPTYVSRMISDPSKPGHKRIADHLALKIEANLSLPDGSLINPSNTGRAELTRGPAKVHLLPTSSSYGRDDIEIVHWDTGGAMGRGVVLKDQPGVIQSWRVTPDWIEKNVRHYSAVKNLCVVTGFGDSMRPMFNPGDPLLVDIGVRTVDFDGVYFFRVDQEGFVKRLQRIPGEGIRVLSANRENYEAWTIKKDMDFEVFGRVLKVWCSEDF